MGWCGKSVLDQRVEFVFRASGGESLSCLCREYEITRPTGYLWLRRFREQGVAGIAERSRRPLSCPHQTSGVVEARIVELRRQRPDWGARKLAVLLEREGTVLPVITVHRILLRHGLVLDRERRRQATTRFEREAPNQLWQMDFKGQKDADAAVGPLSVLDDHSRYLVALEQTGTTRGEVVRERLEDIFRSNGVPEAMLMDHGVPWWGTRSARGWTQLSVWLMEQGIRCCFSGIGHPQTQGKVERFHGALERARQRPGAGVWLQQSWLDAFRHEYNQIRPHEALAMQTPASRWHPSPKTYDPNPPEWDYGQTAQLRKVNTCGEITINDTPWRVSVALRRKYVQIQRMDQRIFVFYCKTLIRETPNPLNICKGCPDNNL